MKKVRAIIDLLDAIYYITAGIGIFVAAAYGSLIWVCVCGFCLIDGGLTVIAKMMRKEPGAENEST